MSASRFVRLLVVLLLSIPGALPLVAHAQQATPAASPAGGGLVPEMVASGLTNPRGMTWGADGTLFVALAGSGGPNAATEDAPTTAILGPFMGGPTGAVASIDASGCPVLIAGGLPSSMTGTGEVLGADDVAILGDQLYAAVDGGGPVHGNADAPSGVYRLINDGSSVLVADLSTWVRENPVATLPGDADPDAAGYSIVADPASNLLWVGDPNSSQILAVTPDGVVSRIADLSVNHPVPTKMVADPNGGVYVGSLTAVPFPDGAAKVMHIAADGTVTDVWTGLTVVTDVAVGADGSLYAIEMSTGNLAEPPFLQPGTGRLVHQTGPDSLEVLAEGLMLPIAMDMGPDGAFYVAMPAIGANAGEGMIMRFALDSSTIGTAMSATCAPLPETLAGPTGAATPAAGATEAAAPTEAPAATPTDAPAAESGAVTIAGFAFTPQTLEVSVGTTVTWTNADSTAHTASATDGSWDTGNIDPGTSGSITFDTPGTYTYYCMYHPNMTGTIVVS